ncbi:MAG: HD domain-containing protein [Spirochaetaceae bacterium]|nr:MAG: HD domain-containing protein [Spirochaetaceae bacterium]
MTELDAIIQHLNSAYDRPIRDPVWHHVYLSEPLVTLVSRPEMLKLTRIKQLGPSYLVYPGATHTRLNHSIGVFHLARRIIQKLVFSASCPSLTLIGVKSFLTAALLHDLGHFPYTHSLKELSLEEHEHLAALAIRGTDLGSYIRDTVGADPDMVASIIDEERIAPEGTELTLYRSILSGALDPDKLDYLNRDAYFCGVPYGLQDVDFVIDQLEPLPDYRLALKREGIQAVETILFSKYLMYRAVYWHKTVRVATAMIKKGLYLSLRDRYIMPDALYGLDDESFVRVMQESGSPSAEIIGDVSMRRFHKVLYDIPFDAENAAITELSDMGARTRLEADLAREMTGMLGVTVDETDVIIDIPERVSFEVEMPITERGRIQDFPDAGSVFTTDVVREFTASLRRVRVMCRAHDGLTTEKTAPLFASAFGQTRADQSGFQV